MGCDIHAYVEVVYPGDHAYAECIADLLPGRYYAVFGVLANVRGSGAPIEPRGIPTNLSIEVANEYFERPFLACPDWHSTSWLLTAELKQVEEAYKAIYEQPFPLEFRALVAFMEALDLDSDPKQHFARFVFWFDN